MNRVDRFIESLAVDGVTGPKTRFKFLESFAKQLEQELASVASPPAAMPKWVHCSERLPTAPGKYVVIVYYPKADGKVLTALPFQEDRTFMTPPDASVAYWLEGLTMPPFYSQFSHALNP
jgi:hypothetical protein